MTTIVQGGTNNSIVTAIQFWAVSDTGDGTTINLFYNDGGTRKLIGQVQVPGGYTPNVPGASCWFGTWSCPFLNYFLANADKIDAVMTRGTVSIVALAIGGDY